MKSGWLLWILCGWLLHTAPNCPAQEKAWMLGPFSKADTANPVLGPLPQTVFRCPMRNAMVAWEANHVFNPAVTIKDGKVYMLYRAEDTSGAAGIGAHTSRIGLAVSSNGTSFVRNRQPVLYPAADAARAFEWDGGCEDPRVVRAAEGMYVLTYTMWDRKTARIGVATSRDLQHWTKHGSIFSGRFRNQWSKSGAIVCALKNGQLTAVRINGRYWMYWGDTDIWLASSPDLIHWTPVLDSAGKLLPVLSPRKGSFDSNLVEPGPPAVLTDQGIVLLYNARNDDKAGDTTLPAFTYAAGQALLDARNPAIVKDRSAGYFIRPERPYELTGQYKAGTVFIEGLVRFKGKWWLYYGTADSKVAVAVAEK